MTVRLALLVAIAAATATGVGLATPAAAKLVGGQVERRSAVDPAAEIATLPRSSATRWLAWSVPARGRETICNFGLNAAAWGVSLDEERSSWGSRSGAPAIGVAQVEIYVSVREGAIQKMRLASEGCPVEAGAQPILWLDGVRPAASVELLARLAARHGEARSAEEIAEQALAGLSVHAAPEAPLALVHLSREGAHEDLRSQALFWLAQSGEPAAARWIREAIARDPASEVREQGVFALSQLDEATAELLAVLRESRDRDVKRQALFWLGQSDDPEAAAELERLLTR